jgi:predicted SPOUT superfamily RNA methylase MTH1
MIFREGVVSEKPAKSGKGCYANIGLSKDVKLDKIIEPGFRVTVKLLPQVEGSKKIKGLAVSPRVPLQENGLYWGYDVRLAKCFTEVIDNCPYKNGYDLLIGTSDKGSPVSKLPIQKKYRHCIIFFGGVDGLEQVFQDDEKLSGKEPSTFFNYYVNTCPKQGSRTIRTEEAIFISLAMLYTKLTV